MGQIKNNLGFTLIELVVVTAILAILSLVAIEVINPVTQISKARDAQKKSDFEQIRTALDLYYGDTRCYPDANALPFGQAWTGSNGQVYMARVPTSPDSSTPYVYMTEGLCPQWYALYAKSSINGGVISATNKDTCALDNEEGCIPFEEEGNSHICVYGGIVDCNYISQTPLSN